MYCKIDGIDIPLVTTGTSPFIGAGQFGFRAIEWRKKFLNDSNAILEILKASYQAGARGIEAIPIGSIIEASRIMVETYDDYVVTGSTYPGHESGIEDLIKVESKLRFVHGMISDNKGRKLIKLLEEIKSRGVIPGIATHDPVSTINYALNNSLNVRAFLIPFNVRGSFMGNARKLEKLVDNTNNYYFIGMKTLAAGTIDPITAFNYIAKHNICAVTVGMVNSQEAKESSSIALDTFNRKKNKNE